MRPEKRAYALRIEKVGLADKLAQHSGRLSVAQRVESMERQCALAARLIQAMLRQVHSSDVFRLAQEE
jgi:hypothetical protein